MQTNNVAKNVVSNNNGPVVENCRRCNSGGQSIVRIEGFCEQCFVFTYIEPLKKEQRNAEETMQNINNLLYARLNQLGEARNIQAPKSGMRTYLCRKCLLAKFDSSIKLLWHEENCEGSAYKTKKERSPRQRQEQIVTKQLSDADEFFNS